MANNYAEELADAVESIGGEGHLAGIYEYNGKEYYLQNNEPRPPECRQAPHPAAENLATLEAWLRGTLEDRAYFECRYESPHRTQPTVWTVVWQHEKHGRVVIGFAEADTEHKARASSAMQAVKAVLKEKANGE